MFKIEPKNSENRNIPPLLLGTRENLKGTCFTTLFSPLRGWFFDELTCYFHRYAKHELNMQGKVIAPTQSRTCMV